MASLRTWFQRLLRKSSAPTADKQEVLSEPLFEEQLLPPLHPEDTESPEWSERTAVVPLAGRPPVSGAFHAAWITDTGQVRGHNEDALFVLTSDHHANNSVPAVGLFVLADGMGGHQAGEVASSMSVRLCAEHLLSRVYIPLLSGMERGADQPSLSEVVREAILKANRQVTQDLPGSGSTLTCGLVVGDRLFIGHVGDSRAYLLRADEAPRQLTTDHSLVNRLMEMGQLTEEEAAVHPQRNVLYRAIGQGGGLEVDVSTFVLQSRDRLLFCSDGLWGMVEELNLWEHINTADTLWEACVAMVDAANAAGGNDNISIILVEIWQGNHAH